MRDIVVFEPTHLFRESGILFLGCRPPAGNCFYNLPQADVGSAKGKARTTTWDTGVKNCFTRPMRESIRIRADALRSALFLLPCFLFLSMHIVLYITKEKDGIYEE